MMDFEQACEFVGIPATRRQLRKWNQKRGMAKRADMGHCHVLQKRKVGQNAEGYAIYKPTSTQERLGFALAELNMRGQFDA
ncbi:MAG: hypothetical protein V2A73_13080 [Pseudomonadota bacterium]